MSPFQNICTVSCTELILCGWRVEPYYYSAVVTIGNAFVVFLVMQMFEVV